MNNNIIPGVLGSLILVGLVVLIVLELTKQPKVNTINTTKIVPVRYPIYRRYPHRRYVVGDRSNPFCAHTKNGCYPGTTIPIP